MSKALVTVDHQFERTPDGQVWVKTIYGYDFWKRYLEIFDKVRIACRIRDVEKTEGKMLLSSGENVEFFALPQYRGPFEFVKKYVSIQKSMKGVAENCNCAIFRIPSPIASGIKKQVVKQKLPWAVEVVNDPWDTFAPGSYKSITRPAVRVFFTHQVKTMARKANGASYVTQYALQNRYPSYVRLHGEDGKHFESYYSSIILHDDYFEENHKVPTSPYKIIHVNSCVTDYSKGHDVVIKALKKIVDAGIDARVEFIGDGPARALFEQLAEKLGVGDRVSFTGLLSSALEVRQHLLDSDIMVFPTKGEGLPRTVIEAMAVGLPVLSTPVNGIPELLSKDYLIDQQDSDGFAESAIEILTNDELWSKISRRNVDKARQYEDSILNLKRKEFYSCLISQEKKSENTL